MQGFIKLHRKIIEWGWYKKPKTAHLFNHLMIMANHKKNEYQGITVERGQLITGRCKLAFETGLTEQEVRSRLNRLKSTNEITIESTNKNSLITVCNYDYYNNAFSEINQQINQQANQQLTSNQPATNQQLTTNKNVKNDNNEKNVKKRTTTRVDVMKNFDHFWDNYPKKVGKGQAKKTWIKIKPGIILVEMMIENLDRRKQCYEWQKDNGRFIPNPSTWLNSEGWEDEVVIDSGRPDFTPNNFAQAERAEKRSIAAQIKELEAIDERKRLEMANNKQIEYREGAC